MVAVASEFSLGLCEGEVKVADPVRGSGRYSGFNTWLLALCALDLIVELGLQ